MEAAELHLINATLPRAPARGSGARRLIEQTLGSQISAPLLNDAKLIVSELANNAYPHGTGKVQLRASIANGRALIEVIDEGASATVAIRAIDDSGGGRGLRLIDHLAGAWGTSSTPTQGPGHPSSSDRPTIRCSWDPPPTSRNARQPDRLDRCNELPHRGSRHSGADWPSATPKSGDHVLQT